MTLENIAVEDRLSHLPYLQRNVWFSKTICVMDQLGNSMERMSLHHFLYAKLKYFVRSILN